jgi:hypothetical protein
MVGLLYLNKLNKHKTVLVGHMDHMDDLEFMQGDCLEILHVGKQKSRDLICELNAGRLKLVTSQFKLTGAKLGDIRRVLAKSKTVSVNRNVVTHPHARGLLKHGVRDRDVTLA